MEYLEGGQLFIVELSCTLKGIHHPFPLGNYTTQLSLIRNYPTHCPRLASPQKGSAANTSEAFPHTVHPQNYLVRFKVQFLRVSTF